MKVLISGYQARDFASFCDAVATGIAQNDPLSTSRYFGFDLDSFIDCLHGGFLGAPPYDIEVEDGQVMVDALGYAALEQYCRQMLAIIDAGGRGLVKADYRSWYEDVLRDALEGNGPTLLDLIGEAIEVSPASLTLRGKDQAVLAQWIGLPRPAS
ncbi:MAG: hypothetical protein IPH07_06600 [Deltaproteobacteria bacterium]|nr:hypothetical protein [Deltaproteobacteria bacterium]MBK8717977.1 hypothetical protein [Deltaproteobacteria bacterium]MBP7290144.1 hypothetical protein [Nannocystaceae bacterium]